MILVLYFASLCGVLLPAAMALYCAGLCSLGFCLACKREAFSFFRHPGFWAFAALSVWIAVRVRGILPDQYDNYTHWALIMKTMYQTDALPAPGSLVTFTDYPPAAALLGYFVLRCTEFGEDVMLTAQGLLAAAAVSALFAGCGWRRPWRCLFALLAGAAMLSVIPMNLENLYVDSLLGYLASSAAVMIFYGSREGGVRCGASVCIVLSVLILTKQSGALFVSFVLLTDLLLRLAFGGRGRLGRFLGFLPELLLPVLCRGLFSLRVQRVFGGDSGTGADVSYAGALTGLDAKSDGFRNGFLGDFLAALTDLSRYPVRAGACLLAAMLFSAVVFLLLRRSGREVLGLTLAVLYAAVYTAGILFMYAAWMEEGESAQLASFDRYLGSGAIFLIGLSAAAVAARPAAEDMRPRAAGAFLLLFPLALCVYWGVGAAEPDELGFTIRRAAIIELRDVYAETAALIPDSEQLVYCIDDRLEPGYYYYIMRYIFMRRYVWPLEPWCIEEDHWGTEKNDCLILILHTGWMTDNYLVRCFGTLDFAPGLYEKHGASLTLLYPLGESKTLP